MVRIADKTVTAVLALIGDTDIIQLSQPCQTVQVYNRSVSSLYVRMDGVDPVVNGDGSFYVEPNKMRLFAVPNVDFPEIRVVGAGLNLGYIVECFQ